LNSVATDVPNVLPSFQPVNPTFEELEETELAARLILNQLHADVGEQIEIHRTAQGVEVEGLVETDERKHELSAQLMTVPRLKISIQSAEHLRENPPPVSQVVSVDAAAAVDQPSPLEKYLRARGRSLNDINVLSQQFFNRALTISQESNAIHDLKTRFISPELMPVIASATLEELLYSHRERLQEALRQERALVEELAGTDASGRNNASSSPDSLMVEAAKNLTLVKELTQTNLPAARSAEAIFAEMSSTAATIASAARETSAPSQAVAMKSTNRK
jgi:hypothetical protein